MYSLAWEVLCVCSFLNNFSFLLFFSFFFFLKLTLFECQIWIFFFFFSVSLSLLLSNSFCSISLISKHFVNSFCYHVFNFHEFLVFYYSFFFFFKESILVLFHECNVYFDLNINSVQFCSVAHSCLTLCNPMDCSMPGLPVHHQLLEFT